MDKKIHFFFMTSLILLVLIISAGHPILARADSGIIPSPTSSSPSKRTPNSGSSSNSLSQVPSGTKVVIVDSSGNKVPLGSQQAENILAASDPIFCVNTATTIAASAPGCTGPYNTISDLLNYLAGHQPTADGTIWLEGGRQNTSTLMVNINGSSLTTWSAYTLTLQGGWDDTTTNGTINSANPSQFYVPISITNWNNDVTVNNVTVWYTFSSSAGLKVHTAGNIKLNYDTLTNNFGAGLEAVADGDITLSDVTADNNGNLYYGVGGGVYLDNRFGTGNIYIDTDSTGVVTGSSEFNSNVGDGLTVLSSGDVTLTNVTADNNSFWGTYLNSTGVYYLNPGTGKIYVDTNSTGAVTGSSEFNGNGLERDGYGLEALSNGDIVLSNVTANNNYDTTGVYLNTFNYGETNANITISDSDFQENGTYGLDAILSGTLTISGVTADDNTSDGVFVNDSYGNGNIYVDTNSTGTALDPSEFNGNGVEGLYAYSNGDITLGRVTADDNTNDGIFLDDTNGTGSIYVDSNSTGAVNGSSEFNDNGGDGLIVRSNSDITLGGVTADDNDEDGATLMVLSDPTITNSRFNGNGIDGLYLESDTNENVTMTCSTALDNALNGLDGYVGGSLILDGVTLSGNNGLDNNVYSSVLVLNSSYGCGHKNSSVGSGGGLPLNVINVPDSGGQANGLECTQYSGTELVLPNGDQVLLPCPIGTATGTNGSLSRIAIDKLPGALDSQYTFVSGIDLQVTPLLIGMMTVSFKIPSDKENAKFTILHWDGSKWVDLGGSKTTDGFFEVQTNLTGDFVLVAE
jgi:Right handed beta helix region